jgi:Protein of unknown function (DUF2480)
MENEKQIVNRVATSSLITIDLEEFYPKGERVLFDLKDCLFQGIILKEKDFRDFIKAHDWSQYQDKWVAITCSADAIIPTWAYMLLSVALQPIARSVFFGTLAELESHLFHEAVSRISWEQYRDAKVVIKGCSKVAVPASAYVEVTNYLRPLAASIMYGEACSTVPLFKRPKG